MQTTMNRKTNKIFQLSPIIFLFLVCSTSSCIQSIEKQKLNLLEKNKIGFEVKYAKGFSLNQSEKETKIIIHDPISGIALDSLDISGSSKNKTRYFQRIVAQSTTHFAFLQKINQLESLIGLCGIQYLQSKQKDKLYKTQEICNGQGLDPEKVVALNPDLVFLYPFGDQDKSKLNRLNIKSVYLTEYLESSPLARAEWLKFFSLITDGNSDQTAFETIEKEYIDLTLHNPTKKNLKSSGKPMSLKNHATNLKFSPNLVAFNLPFGDTWDMPSANSITGNLVLDAGLSYFQKDKNQNGNMVFKLEEAYNHLSKAEFWIIIAARPAEFSLETLLAENRIFKNFPAVKMNHVFFCNTETTSYFSEGPIEPHILLRDLISCINGQDSKNKYFRILK